MRFGGNKVSTIAAAAADDEEKQANVPFLFFAFGSEHGTEGRIADTHDTDNAAAEDDEVQMVVDVVVAVLSF